MDTAPRLEAIRASNVAAPSGTAAPPLSANASTGLVHLYRAEVGRMTAYRQRLDTTTAWAITTSGLVATFALGNASISHAAFLFLMLLLLFFLVLEGRLFRSYEASRIRVVLLECSFFPTSSTGLPPTRAGWTRSSTCSRIPRPP